MSHFISLEKAIAMTTTYRKNRDEILIPELKGKDILPKCLTYDRAAFDKLISNDSCSKIRIYFGMDDERKVHAIIVGVNEKDEDILPGETEKDETTEDDEPVIVDEGVICPPHCPPPSHLNP